MVIISKVKMRVAVFHGAYPWPCLQPSYKVNDTQVASRVTGVRFIKKYNQVISALIFFPSQLVTVNGKVVKTRPSVRGVVFSPGGALLPGK